MLSKTNSNHSKIMLTSYNIIIILKPIKIKAQNLEMHIGDVKKCAKIDIREQYFIINNIVLGNINKKGGK